MEFFVNLLSDFDPAALLPQLDTMLGKVELLVRIAVLAGPAVLLILGLWYLILPPKEANHTFGYRFFWGMSSVESWRFTQKTAGIVRALLGLVLGGVMYFLTTGFRGKEMIEMLMLAVQCILWELGLVAVSCLLIDILVVIKFDSKGVSRKEKRMLREQEPMVRAREED